MLRRLATHAGVVGFAVFVLATAGLQWTAHAGVSPVAAAAEVTPTTKADAGNHGVHIPAFPRPTTTAISGSTGNSTGDHIDFRIRYQARAFLDPMQFLP